MAVAEREILTWEAFGEGGRELARMVADDGYRPDIILAIARGGLFTAGILGYALSVKNIYLINVEYYTGVEERLPIPVALPPTPGPATGGSDDQGKSIQRSVRRQTYSH